jgi:hypothetical protein
MRLIVNKERVRCAILWDVNPGDDARIARALADKNGDGALDPKELAALKRFLAGRATVGLGLKIGGVEVTPEQAETEYFGVELPLGSTGAFGIRLAFDAKLKGSERELEIELDDKSTPANVDMDVPVVVELDPAFLVAFATQGELHSGKHQIRRVRLNNQTPVVLRLKR